MLVLDAIKEAVSRRKIKRGLIFHSDQGVQYTSTSVQELLDKFGFISSMSSKGSCYDNAAMESFWSTLKRECIRGTPPLIISNMALRNSCFFAR